MKASAAVSLLALLAAQSSAQDTARRPRAYVHIGPHKTASTSIQYYFCNRRAEHAEAFNLTMPLPEGCTATECVKYFAASAIISEWIKALACANANSYPCPNPNPNPDLNPSSLQALQQAEYSPQIPSAAVELDAGKNIWDRWAQCELGGMEGGSIARLRQSLAQSQGDVWISSEEFDGVSPWQVRYLADILSGYDVQIIMFYRSKLDHLMTTYVELNKGREVMQTLPKFLALDDNVHVGLRLRGLVEAYGDAFGYGNVHVISFEGAMAAGLSVEDIVLDDIMMVGESEQRQKLAQQKVKRQFRNRSMNVSVLSAWSFIQEIAMWKAPGTPQPWAPVSPGGTQRQDCLERISEQVIRELGSGWQCSKLEKRIDVLTKDDMRTLQENPQVRFLCCPFPLRCCPFLR